MFDILAHKMKWKSFENTSLSDFFFGNKIGKISHCGMREGAMGGRVTIL